VTRSGGGGGTASATAAVGNDVPRASRSAASSSQGWTFDVRCCRAGGYESRCWTARLEGGGATRNFIVATEDDDDRWDLPPPPAAGATPTDAAMPLSLPSDDGDD
jgi:hypothetical protein